MKLITIRDLIPRLEVAAAIVQRLLPDDDCNVFDEHALGFGDVDWCFEVLCDGEEVVFLDSLRPLILL